MLGTLTTMSDPTRPSPDVDHELKSLDRVRRRVTVIGFLAVALHAVVALPLIAQHLAEEDRVAEAVMMLVLTALAGVLIVVVARLILGYQRFSLLWTIIGLLPLAIGIYLTWWAPFTLH